MRTIAEQEGRTLADELDDPAILARLDVTSDRNSATTVAATEDVFGPVSCWSRPEPFKYRVFAMNPCI